VVRVLLLAVGVVAIVVGHSAAVARASAITKFPIPTRNSGPIGIVAGPDGALWFTENNANKIGRITTAGKVSEFRVPPVGGGSFPIGIAAGPDGALWFTEPGEQQIGRITIGGTVSEFYVSDDPGRITSGPDGALWFTEPRVIGRITTGGEVSEFSGGLGRVRGITAGPDGALWFTENGALQIGRITTTGAISQFSTPSGLPGVDDITSGPDGALWFVDLDKIGRMTTDGRAQEFALPTSGIMPAGIAADRMGRSGSPSHRRTESGASRRTARSAKSACPLRTQALKALKTSPRVPTARCGSRTLARTRSAGSCPGASSTSRSATESSTSGEPSM
jgi:virginiamycin B lyase